jgi:ATP-dependent Clp protease ATP-binding subunit ClpA
MAATGVRSGLPFLQRVPGAIVTVLPLTVAQLRALDDVLAARGVGSLPALHAGAMVDPPEVEVVFVRVDNGLEVWLPDTARLSQTLIGKLRRNRPIAHGGQLLFKGGADLRDTMRALDFLLDHPRITSTLTDVAAVVASVKINRAQQILSAPEISAFIKQRIAGHERPIEVLARVVGRFLQRQQPRNPASLLLVGPTGNGKTETARQVAACLSAVGYGCVQINANEYTEKHRVSEILGAPPGYVGHSSRGSLADRLGEDPKCVVIVDEIDKAHADLLDALMSAMSSGQLSRSGRLADPVDCRTAVFLFTSNALGDEADELAADVESPVAEISDRCRDLLVKRGMRPEIAGRFSAVVPFGRLTEQGEVDVAARVVVELAEEYGVNLTWIAPGLIAQLLRPRQSNFGARSVKALADEMVGDVLANAGEATGSAEVALVGPPWRLEQRQSTTNTAKVAERSNLS